MRSTKLNTARSYDSPYRLTGISSVGGAVEKSVSREIGVRFSTY